jgi:pyrroloquinoline quinone biosynthesis protein B
MGHYVGLAQLGKEAASTDRLPVHCSESVATFLQENKPFSYLIDREEIVLQTFESGEEFNIGDSTSITPIEVPHRNEDGDTHGFVIKSLVSQKECLYLPDIDRLTDEVVEMISSVDITLFDATFWSKAELPRQFDVPHPPMTEVVERLGVIKDTRFIFTHFNHSNPVLHNSLHQQYLKTRGYEVGSDGMELNLI